MIKIVALFPLMKQTIAAQKATIDNSQEQAIQVENLIAEINALTARIKQLRQRYAVSIARK
ncbi:hypothetical protein AVDCRST_MAG92-1758 [uncultured Coleofasciculus sp.]|uniref:Uncharacterized protein n=1 Tax=uncultured Coleofasciculus sp. TaxID=1267456 RepID=A0A6J4I991_9CYAN|nr:hypothetical protein AVDCRST_MAG92-1758 [uncultured Coleofasciculus sp.]